MQSDTTVSTTTKPGRQFSRSDFLDFSKPWVLGDTSDKAAFDEHFDFIPRHYRYGPWHVGTFLVLGLIFYVLTLSATWMFMNPPNKDGWISLFQIEEQQYEPFTLDWYVCLASFVWMEYVRRIVMYDVSPMGQVIWISYTFWSWTVITIRQGLLVFAPWVPFLRIPAEILRFPALQSATLTTCMWNLVLFPAITLLYIKNSGHRKQFIGFFTNFKLTQLHIFNIGFAAVNGAYTHPRRPLFLGDLLASVLMLVLYMIWYLCVLDRLGIHLYPILSPRTPLVVPSVMFIIAATFGNYYFWQGQLPIAET